MSTAFGGTKPFEIGEPTILQGEQALEICALFCMASYQINETIGPIPCVPFRETLRRVYSYCKGPYRQHFQKPCEPLTNSNLVLTYWRWILDSASTGQSTDDKIMETSTKSSSSRDIEGRKKDASTRIVSSGTTISGFQCEFVVPIDAAKDFTSAGYLWVTVNQLIEQGQQTPPPRDFCVQLEESDIRRFDLASRALKRNPELGQVALMTDQLHDGMGNWPWMKELAVGRYDGHFGLKQLSGFAIAGLMYGGLHLLAWHAPFASRAEEVLWRFSGIVVASMGLVIMSVVLLYELNFPHVNLCKVTIRRRNLWSKNVDVKVPDLVSFARPIPFSRLVPSLWVLVLASLLLAYVLARTYLVVECFLQLARLPPSAYELPQWSQYFPHIT